MFGFRVTGGQIFGLIFTDYICLYHIASPVMIWYCLCYLFGDKEILRQTWLESLILLHMLTPNMKQWSPFTGQQFLGFEILWRILPWNKVFDSAVHIIHCVSPCSWMILVSTISPLLGGWLWCCNDYLIRYEPIGIILWSEPSFERTENLLQA